MLTGNSIIRRRRQGMVTGLQRVASFFVVMFMWAVLPGCGGSDGGTTTNIPGGSNNPSTPTGTGAITGRLNVPLFTINSNSALATVSSGEKDKHPTEPDFVPGELLVQLMPSTNDATALTHLLEKYVTLGLTKVGRLSQDGPFRLRTNVYRDATLSREDAKARTEAALRTLEADPSVERVSFNYLMYPQQTTSIPNVRPNDTGYVNSFLWGQRLIDLPNAWGITTGRSEVIVAVLDSGIQLNHPELRPRLVPGADFVEEGGLEKSGDGNGIDRDPTDIGPFPATGYHGTHVAATIAAESDNGKGVSGVAWNARILPVRVLGLFGGSLADIVNGMRWAAGIPFPDAPPLPSTPAKVINMSLSGDGNCADPIWKDYRDAIGEILKKGVSIVVAAGNVGDKGNAKQVPASCEGVIAVAAVDVNGNRSPYSAVQDYVFIAAPGGYLSTGPSGEILSAIGLSALNQPTYGYYQGTSMAAPHVAGVIALMHSAALDGGQPLDDAKVKKILQLTAKQKNGTTIRDSEYGFGILQAGAAVYQAKVGAAPDPSSLRPVPYPNPPQVIRHADFVLANFPLATVNVADRQNRDFCFEILPPKETWLKVSGQANSYDLSVIFNMAGVQDVFSFQRSLNRSEFGVRAFDCFNRQEIETFKVPVELSVGFNPIRIQEGNIVVRAFGINPANQKMEELGRTQTNSANDFRFTIPSLPSGRYYVEAGTDTNQSNQFGDDPQESYGKYPEPGLGVPVLVEAGKRTSGINFPVVDGKSIQTLD